MSEKDNSVPPLSFEIERQARIKRSLVIQASVRGIMRAFAEGSFTSEAVITNIAAGQAHIAPIFARVLRLGRTFS
jgi:hypothetical protein